MLDMKVHTNVWLIKLIKSDSKDICTITKISNKCCSSELSIHQSVLEKNVPQNWRLYGCLEITFAITGSNRFFLQYYIKCFFFYNIIFILQYYWFYGIINQINAALVGMRDFFQKTFKNLTNQSLLNSIPVLEKIYSPK